MRLSRKAYGVSLLWIFFALFCAWQVMQEAVFHIPVLIAPQSGERIQDKPLRFDWNYVTGIPVAQQRFRFEIDRTKDFQAPVYQVTVSENSVRGIGSALPENGAYYYRLCLQGKDRPCNWTKPIRFLWLYHKE